MQTDWREEERVRKPAKEGEREREKERFGRFMHYSAQKRSNRWGSEGGCEVGRAVSLSGVRPHHRQAVFHTSR